MTPIEFLFDGQVRWSFGFENPNKAAVIFVCLLPLLWIAWDAGWRRARPVVWVLAGLLMLTAWSALCLTYSRGGLVAAVVAFLYVGLRQWRSGGRLPRTRWVAAGVLAVLAAGIVVGTGLGGRTVNPLAEADASVGNRLVLWRSALQMAADRPLGFGAGRSGAAYMEWYQPLEMNAGYRTMVSGYLTPLVEHGWWVCAVVALGIVGWWVWCDPRPRAGQPAVLSPVATGLRASLVGFAMAAVFSTITEDRLLWIAPGAVALLLTGWTLSVGSRATPRRFALGLGFCALFLVGLYAVGRALAALDGIERRFGPDNLVVIAAAGGSGKRTGMVPDTEVLGPLPGRLVRELVMTTGGELVLAPEGTFPTPVERVILCGNAVRLATRLNMPLELVCPVPVSESEARGVLARNPRLWLPEIDNDGRGLYWRSLSEGADATVETIPGVGIRIDWAWSELITKLVKME